MKWIKLYTEILDDPKIQRLPKSVRWTATSCFLVAGEMEQGGYIGRLDDLAWRLRENEEEMSRDIDVLVQVGIIEWDGDDLVVTKYEERQGDNTGKYRKRVQRSGENKSEKSGHGTVTGQSRDSTALEQTRIDKTRLEERREEKSTLEVNFDSDVISFDADDTTPVLSCDPWCYEFADAAADVLKARDLLPKKWQREKWANVFRLLNEQDGYQVEDIRKVMSWLFKPDNWWMRTRNFRTVAKLRMKSSDGESTYFEVMQNQMRNGNQTTTGTGRGINVSAVNDAVSGAFTGLAGRGAA